MDSRPTGYSDEQMRQYFNSFVARTRAKKALKDNHHYKNLLQQHKDLKNQMKNLEDTRSYLWHEIQVTRDQTYQQELWKINEKEEQTNAK